MSKIINYDNFHLFIISVFTNFKSISEVIASTICSPICNITLSTHLLTLSLSLSHSITIQNGRK